MFATLLIKNIGNLYTCDKRFKIFHHAFIAVYHDTIIDLGDHDYHKWIDSSTYVIDAASRAVIPGFIEPKFIVNEYSNWNDKRKIEEKINHLSSNGTLTICTEQEINPLSKLTCDVIKVPQFMPILSNLYFYKLNKNYLLSCQDNILSQHAMGVMLHYSYKENPKNILKAMTSNVATAYNIMNRGTLKKGYNADILVLNDKNIQDFYSTIGKPLYARIIKNGIPIYPNIQRV